MGLNRPKMGGGEEPVSRPPHADPGEFGRAFPALAEALSSSSWSDGTPKRPARLSLSIYGRRWIAQLDLIGAGCTLRVEVPDPLLTFESLEAALGQESVPWEPSDYVPVDKERKPKK